MATTLRLDPRIGELRLAAEEDYRSARPTLVLAVETYLALRETAEVRADPEALRALAKARQAVQEGDVVCGQCRCTQPAAGTPGFMTARYKPGTASRLLAPLNPGGHPTGQREDPMGGIEPGGKPCRLTATQAPTGQADEIERLRYTDDLV
jgi:hypothetical protein